MHVYLVQHGEARSEQEDPDRPLTERGVADVRRVIRLAAELAPIAPRGIHHSGRTRARQTAELWGDALGVPVSEALGLAPRDDVEDWTKRVAETAEALMLVGHLPHLARLAGALVAKDAERTPVSFRQGALVGLERKQDEWSVSLLLPPRLE